MEAGSGAVPSLQALIGRPAGGGKGGGFRDSEFHGHYPKRLTPCSRKVRRITYSALVSACEKG